MRNTRQEIVSILEREGPSTVRELAEAIRVSPMSVRHHLQNLREAGEVMVAGRVQRRQVGRPQYRYALVHPPSPAVGPDYADLLQGLLEEVHLLLGSEGLRDWLLRVARQGDLGLPEGLVQMPLEARLREATACLSRQGYMARWERQGDTWWLYGYNCPYYPLAQAYPALCEMDVAMLSRLLGEPVQQTEAIPWEDGRCAFRLMAEPLEGGG